MPGGNGNCVFEVYDAFGPEGERNVIGVAISHVDDWLIGLGDFVELLAGQMQNRTDVSAPEENGAI